MDITELSTAEILAELEKRGEGSTDKIASLVFGTIGIVDGSNFVETFKKIESEKDLDLDMLTRLSLRSRFNPHRYYQGFYFKTTEFEKLEENLHKDSERFADWVRETNSIKYIKL